MIKIKILFIIPPNTFFKGDFRGYIPFPIGIAYLAAVTEKYGCETHVLDCMIEDESEKDIGGSQVHVGLSWEEIGKRVKEINPDIVGISCSYSAQYDNSAKVAKIVKEVNNKALTFIGGSYHSAMPKDGLKDSNIDYVFIGEAENTIIDVLDSLHGKKDLTKIDGIAYRKSNEIVINPKTKFIENVDELPFPARHLFKFEKYTKYDTSYTIRKPHATMITSRGCPYDCTFCSIHSIWGYKFRGRSPENVADEIQFLEKEYGIKEIYFLDDIINFDRKRMMGICDEIIKRKIDIKFVTPNGIRVDRLDRELLVKMKEAGCSTLMCSVESADEFILNKVIRKNSNLPKVIENVKIMNEIGIRTVGYFIVGMPGDTQETIMKSADLAVELDFWDAYFAIATPLPGTHLWKMCKENKYVDEDIDTKPTMRMRYANISTPQLSAKEVERLRNRALLKYNFYKAKRHPIEFFSNPNHTWKLKNYSKVLARKISNKLKNTALSIVS